MKHGRTMIFAESIFLIILFHAVTACTGQNVKMIQPRTGATAECSGSSYGLGPLFSESVIDSCARAYENRGFIPLERLPPEDRANLEQRGLLPKD